MKISWLPVRVSFQNGRAIVLDGDKALGEFLDGIDAEVDVEVQAQSRRNA